MAGFTPVLRLVPALPPASWTNLAMNTRLQSVDTSIFAPFWSFALWSGTSGLVVQGTAVALPECSGRNLGSQKKQVNENIKSARFFLELKEVTGLSAETYWKRLSKKEKYTNKKKLLFLFVLFCFVPPFPPPPLPPPSSPRKKNQESSLQICYMYVKIKISSQCSRVWLLLFKEMA